MLNSALVEQFGAIHRQRKSGVLTVVGNGFRLRFCLQNGDPVAMDFCADKEVIIANTLLDFHKVAPELHQHLVEARKEGKGTVTEIVRRRQVASEEEIGQVTRAMVEDTLCRCFGSMHYEMVFDEQDGIASFDFDTTAVRLRIGTAMLLSTVQSRVAEIDRVMHEVGGGDAVYNFAESETGSVPLSEYEKHVLNFIDGHKSVEEIAIAFRESTLNMSRLIAGMSAKGVVQRAVGSVSRLKAVVPQPGVAEGAADAPPASPAPAGEAAPPARAPQRSSVGNLVVLGSALALVVVVWLLMVQWRGRNAALDSAATALETALGDRQWTTAAQLVAKSDQDAGNDLEAKRRVGDMQARYDAALKSEQAAIAKLLEQSDFANARQRLERLPEGSRPDDLRTRLASGEAEFTKRSTELRDRVGKLLDDGNVAGALAEIARAQPTIRGAATEHLERWRLTSLERAAAASSPISQRMALINQVMAANPTPHQREQVGRIQAEFTRLQQRSTEQVRSLKKQSDRGAFAEVAAEYERLRLGDQMRGTPMAAEAEALRRGNERVRAELTGLDDEALKLVRSSDDAKAMAKQVAAINQALAAYPLASNAAELKLALQLLGDMGGIIGERTAADEAVALDSWISDRQPPAEVAAFVKDRAARLRAVEAAAEEALDNGRAFARLGDWDEAQRTFEDLLAHAEWKRTVAHAAARRELDELGSAKAQQQAWKDDLNRAMLAGAIDECYRIQQKMGLKYLPLLVQSLPAGAEIWRDGKQVGTTPCTFDIPAGERRALNFELRKPGFAVLTVGGERAEGGWLIQADLEREAAARFDLAMTVTARPTVLAGRLWLANRQQAVALAPGAKPERLAIEPSNAVDALGQPLYAAPVAAADAVYFATREGLAIRATPRGNERLVLGGRTDFALAIYTSQVIVSRRFLIAAGLDGVLHASDEHNPTAFWNGASGEPFAGPPCLIGDRVLTVRRDGTIEVYQADDGRLVARRDLGAAVVAMWTTDGGLAGLTATAAWTCDGQEPRLSKLPQTAVAGGEDVFLTSDNRVWLRARPEADWQELGRVEGRLSAQPRRWNDLAVVPLGTTLAVVGPRGFKVAGTSDFLAPVIVGSQLAVVTATGQASFYSP